MSQNEASNNGPVAFFDFIDGTLMIGDTLVLFLKLVVGRPTYYTKLLRNDITKQIVLKQYLAGYHLNDLFE